jgi:hypothetical protein
MNLKQELEESQHKQTQKMVELQAKMQSHLHLKRVDSSIHLAARYTQLLTWQYQRTKEHIEA